MQMLGFILLCSSCLVRPELLYPPKWIFLGFDVDDMDDIPTPQSRCDYDIAFEGFQLRKLVNVKVAVVELSEDPDALRGALWPPCPPPVTYPRRYPALVSLAHHNTA
jgi:hypothetical protein